MERLRLTAVIVVLALGWNWGYGGTAQAASFSRKESRAVLYTALRSAIRDSLVSRLAHALPERLELSLDEVRLCALGALNHDATRLRIESPRQWVEGKGEQLFESLSTYIIFPDVPLKYDSMLSAAESVDIYLRNLFREQGASVTTERSVIHNLSWYQVVAGLRLLHTDRESRSAHSSIEIVGRTRLKDWRVPPRTIKIREIGQLPEGRFLDILMECTIVSSAMRYETLPAANGSGTFSQPGQFFGIAAGLYFVPWKYRFTDYGALGAFSRIEVSSFEGSDDLFRRIVFGVRMESRAPSRDLIQRGIEVGLAPQSVPGSLQKSQVVGLGRFCLRVIFPVKLLSSLSFTMRLSTEWNLGSRQALSANEFTSGIALDVSELIRGE